MPQSQIRIPKQQRSIDKMNKIIVAGYKLFSEKGYHNTNTAEIAKEAGVSTGIVYNYFENKKAIFLKAIEYYAALINQPISDNLDRLPENFDLEIVLIQILDAIVDSHNMAMKAHEEMLAMSHLDKDVRDYFDEFEKHTCQQYLVILEKIGFKLNHPNETMRIILQLLENYAHDYVYHHHDYLDFSALKKQTIYLIMVLLNQNNIHE